jgi:aromatic ring-opening dioxygenase catalytic subunit (LigB family)
MADLVGIFAASHTPVMLNFPEAIPDEQREEIFSAFRTVGEKLREAKPDVLIVVSDDHLHNFFLDNLPAFCVGAAGSYVTPIEHWLKATKRTLRGCPEFSAHLLETAFKEGFDPAFSLDLTLDHGALTPLELAGLSDELAIVPLLVNCVQPPLPTMTRCLQWGKMLRKAIESYSSNSRIAILATGGISHDIATPRMGLVNEEFDQKFISLLAEGDDPALLSFATEQVHTAGNGAEEIRNWLIAHGAANGMPGLPIFYKAVANWYTGIGLASWAIEGSKNGE